MKPQIIALTVILLSLPIAAHLFMDMYKQKHGIPIKHWQSGLLALVVSLLVGLCSFDEKLQFAAFAFITHFSFFDPLWNLFHKQPLNYHGDPKNPDRSWFDKQWDICGGIPWAEPFIRLVIFGVGYGIYYNWSMITGSYQGY